MSNIESSEHGATAKQLFFDEGFNERSELTQAIINRAPGFFEKGALPFFLLLLVLLVTASWFISYPEVIESSAVLTSDNAPKEIVPKQSGKLVNLFVYNSQQVRNGEILAWIETNASTQEVIDLSGKLSKAITQSQNPDSLRAGKLFTTKYENLGELQVPYQTLLTAWQQYSDYLVNGFFQKKLQILNADISVLGNIRQKMDTQRTLTAKQTELAGMTFEMYEKLYSQKVISTEEFRQAQAILLNNRKSLPQADATILLQQTQVRDKEKEVMQIHHDILQQQVLFDQALRSMKANVDEWLKKYTIQSPTDGQIVFSTPIQRNSYVEQGKAIGFVNPLDSKYYAEIKMTQNNFGKIDTGMTVQLRFDAYPYQEVGFVEGKLNYLSKIVVDSFFIGTVRLNNGLTTNRNRALLYKNGLKARAIIIAKDKRLLERIYYSIAAAMEMTK